MRSWWLVWASGLLVSGLSAAAGLDRTCPWQEEGLEKWSDPETWYGYPPGPRDTIVVTKPILLDIETPALEKITIIDGGKLIFDPSHKVRLTADDVLIMHNGSLIIGNPECEYKGDVEIVFTGGDEDPDVSFGHYTKGLYVDVGGNLDIHGANKLSWTQLATTLEPLENTNEYILQLVDQPKGWKAGDMLVIASTDFDMNQAEEVEVISCDPCSGLTFCTCKVKGEIRYTHYGEIYKGIDMRAEVGLLTRNIKIYGDMKDENDTYGGHMKAFEGFETFRIRGAEFTKMGQKGIKGRYPIHWHMAKTVDSTKTYAKDNSLHHLFQRCITVHGTHGVTVENNVAYNTFGHCYFLEDGGEKNNTLHHNLGLVTKFGTTIPSDRRPSTFWITSPLNVLTENHAAGSDGVGIWYIFAEDVTGPSADEGFFQHGEAFRTEISTFEGNSVHSNLHTGFFFGHHLLPDQDFNGPGGTEYCNPRVDPLDPDSPPGHNIVKDLTAFKNIEQNTWNDCRYTTYDDFKSADAILGISMAHDGEITNSIFVGESNNLGEPNLVKLRNGTQVMWHRSTPVWHAVHDTYMGIQLYDGNPYVHGNTFTDFYNDGFKVAGGIGFRKPHAGEWPTLFMNSIFDFDDGAQGNYVHGSERGVFGGHGGTERMGQIFDWDGTITGKPRHFIVRDQPFYTSSWCEPKPNWGNMSICPHRYVNGGGTGAGFAKIDNVITRNDIPEYPEINNIYQDPWHPKLSSDHSYLYSFLNSSWPGKFHLALSGLDSGYSLMVGICYPFNVKVEDLEIKGTPKPNQLESYEELLDDTTGAGYYIDTEVGALFRKFQVDLPRVPECRERCVGHCPEIFIITQENEEDLGDADCRSRAYPKYQVDPL